MDIVDQLKLVWACRRCECRSCGREGAGELHDHVCTDGMHCIETRERLLKIRSAEAIIARRAAAEIKKLRRQLSEKGVSDG